MIETRAIRAANPADLPALHRLIESAYRGDSARNGWTHEADPLDGQRTDMAVLSAILEDSSQTLLRPGKRWRPVKKRSAQSASLIRHSLSGERGESGTGSR